ncbi:YkgJ family cysteine cluster protein [Uliginosibacterium sp. H3]|uniref:YkgJ family cysteine cluster protein n=1 Tax=Uliginosibacterium silvisoli TaxID=3114758 RepID=A0ABU6K2S3_9RHOO|nr:YkgJ family cysteine cluster protein [Uliginosibacterium sp. H3]
MTEAGHVEPVEDGRNDNSCLNCGACCTDYRVSFYWGEADDAPGGYVPADLTVQVTPVLRAMRGTHPQALGCVALKGKPGECVACGIYLNRPTPCREFDTHEADGTVNPRCNAGRARLGLAPLQDKPTAQG